MSTQSEKIVLYRKQPVESIEFVELKSTLSWKQNAYGGGVSDGEYTLQLNSAAKLAVCLNLCQQLKTRCISRKRDFSNRVQHRLQFVY